MSDDDVDRIRQALRWVPSGYTNCDGDKCRHMNCQACWMDPDEAPGPAVGLKALGRLVAENKRLREALERMVSWDDVDGPGALERQTMTMTQLIGIARQALHPETQP